MFVSCKKNSDEHLLNKNTPFGSITERTDADFALTTLDVHAENGVLCFKDSSTLEAVLKSLELLEDDKTFNDNYLASKGVLIPNSPEDEAFPYEPAYHAFNERFSGVTTLYKFAEDQEYSFLENGGDVSDIPQFEVDDDDMQIVLNQYNEVKVGNLIYKYLNEDQFFVITGNDFSRLQYLRTLASPHAVKRTKNAVLIDNRIIEDQQLYQKLIKSSNSTLGPDCDGAINVTKTGERTYTAENVSLLDDCSQYSMLWRITDGNNNLLYSASQGDQITYTVPNGTTLPVSVSLNIITECCDIYASELMTEPCENMDNISLGIETQINGNYYTFRLLQSIAGVNVPFTQNYSVQWDFGDNSPLETRTNSAVGIHTYNTAGPIYLVKATITLSNGCSKLLFISFESGCGTRPMRKQLLSLGNAPFNGNYELFLKMKIKNNGKVMKSKMVFYKKNNSGNFKRHKADELGVFYNRVVPVRFIDECTEYNYPAPFSSETKPNASRMASKIYSAWGAIIGNKLQTKKDLTRVDFKLTHLGTELYIPMILKID